MSKKSKQLRTELMQILKLPDISITKQNFDQYCQYSPFVSYFVCQGIVRKFEMSIYPEKFGMSYYTIFKDNGDKFSCHVRSHATFFRRQVANDVLEIYNELNLRYLIQQSKRKEFLK
ncbi:MAG: hypothetical protein K5912_01350 [Alphaproteobacteria bacterium]|nr:hypothetical protein [Alphaproteobacteria bacterium]